MKLTVRCLVVTLGLALGMIFMAPNADPQTAGLLGAWALAAFAVTLFVGVLELLGITGRVLEWLAGWKRRP